jgi:Ca-activated chloride channel family protein
MKKRSLFLFAILFIAAAFGGRAAPARAQTAPPLVQDDPPIVEPTRRIEPTRIVRETVVPEPPCLDCPVPPVWDIDGLTIPSQRIDVTIEDQVATTHIDQVFRNDVDWTLEGMYFFPLPPGAAVSQLTMWVDGVPIEAKILPRDEARGIYDAIVRQMLDPALLEYVGSDAIQANVFPIPPGEERRIEIEYQQVLAAENGAFRYVFPQSVDLYTDRPIGEQSIRVDLRAGEAIRTLYSPSHPVAISRDGDFAAVIGYEDTDVLPDRDFELYYTVTPEDIGLTLLSYKQPGEDGFFLLLVAPGIVPGEVVAKDVILVLDTSGSMEGEKMQQAKDAAAYVVEHLNPDDRFAVVSFSTGVSLYEPGLLPAAEPGAVARYIDSLEAVGGTNISAALLEAAALVDPERPTTIIFMTDGLATEGITDTGLLLQNVAAAMPDNARIFAFGVGNDVDTMLLDTLAAEQRGTTTYVRHGQAIDESVSAFYARVASPVLTDLLLDTGDIRTDQVYPIELPDLFAGTQLVVAGRYREGGPATVTLRGTTNGEERVYRYPDQTFVVDGGRDFIPRLWATRAIGHMMQQVRLRGEDPELVQSIVALSRRYGVITPYTSFLIEEDDIFAQTAAEDAALQLAAPADVSGAAAVDRASTEVEMAAAEAAPALPATTTVRLAASGRVISGPTVREAAGRAFYWQNGVWVDGAHDPGAGEPQTIPAFSDAYFDLLAARPELAEALALGNEVLVVVDGDAYRITAAPGAETGGPLAVLEPEDEATGEAAGRAESTPAPAPGEAGEGGEGGMTAFGVPCSAALILPLLLVAGFGANGLARRRR